MNGFARVMKRLRCREATRLASQRLDGRLGTGERIALQVHLLICEGCRGFTRQLDFLRRAVQRLPEERE
jgi:predicted anti-sigma-YlaC factor YlaD